MKANGSVHKYGDNVDTDVIIPARYLNSSDPKELAEKCMIDIDKDFVNRVKPGDIMVANRNFGCGSSREYVMLLLLEARIRCVVAKSFSRGFYRACINQGLLPIVCNIQAEEGSLVQVDTVKGTVRVEDGKEHTFPPFPELMMNIISEGGLINYFKKHGKLA